MGNGLYVQLPLQLGLNFSHRHIYESQSTGQFLNIKQKIYDPYSDLFTGVRPFFGVIFLGHVTSVPGWFQD